jgi:hypothetical protein
MLKLSLQRTVCLWLLCLLAGLADAQDITATWDFKDEATISQLAAASESADPVTISNNGIDLTVESNGNKIEATEDGITIEDGVAFKVPVNTTLDAVTVKGGEDFAYTIGGEAAVEADTD